MSLDRQNLTSFQSLRRIGLSVLSIFILIKLVFSLIGTIDRPQIQGKFELYQTNLVLVAGERKPTDDLAGLGTLQQSIIGRDFLKSATQQYQTARESDLETIVKLRDSLSDLATPANDLTNSTKASDKAIAAQTKLLNQTIFAVKTEIDKIDLRIGILQAATSKTDQAIETWQKVITSGNQASAKNVAASLIDIWRQPSGINTHTAPQIEAEISSSFDGWFRDRALKQLYLDLGDRAELAKLDETIQSRAKSAVIKLALNTIPRLLIGLGGLGLIIFFTIRFVIKLIQQRGERSFSQLLLENIQTPWSTPWDWEIVWQVFTIGFFFVGQFLLPAIFSRFINPATLTTRGQGIYVFSSYLLMSGLSIAVLFLSIKDYLPLQTDWFKFTWKSNWLLWGIGGYLVATPIVIVVSIFNEKIWAGQGGNNPLLQIVLESKDPIGLWLFFLTAAVAAPLFEEFLFRGFLLPSLTRYVPTWGAIGISGLLFGVAHLSLSEIIPLTTLGVILGTVYVRTRNLLAPMLLHSLWNSSTLVSLFILGSSN
jgi:uncharacterized protein